MARQTTSPESLQDVNSIKIDDKIKDFVAGLCSEISSENTNKSSWDSKIKELRDLRYGYRTKKTFPWKNCSNYSIPLIDSHIQKLKPIYVNLYYNSNPLVAFEPFGVEDIEPARLKEQLFDWRMKTKVDIFKDYCIGIDKMLEQGSTVFKIIWDYETTTYTDFIDFESMSDEILNALADPRMTDEILMQILVEELGIDISFEENIEAIYKALAEFKEGKNQIELKLVEVSKNQPKVIACDLKEDLVIPRDTTDIQYARFIEHKIWTTKNDVKKDMNDGKYVKYDDNVIDSWGYGSEYSSNNRVPVGTKTSDVVLLKEVCCWYDFDNDGIKERCIVTYPETDKSSVLRFIEVPYDHGMFPYVQVRRELNDALFYSSRGIPEIVADFQIGISQAVNQTEDNGTLLNSPVIVTKKNTVTNLKNRKYIPGEYVETIGDPSDYQVRQMGNTAQVLTLQFAQYLKSWSDTRIGDAAAGITQATNQSGAGAYGQKTKAEVNLISILKNEISSLDVLVFQMQMLKVYEQIDALYDQYGDYEEEVIITGMPPMRINRRQIQGKYNMVVNGKLDNTDPVKKIGIATSVFRSGINDPDVKQDALKKYYYGTIDPRLAKMLLYTPEEKAAIQQQQMQQAEALHQRAVKEGLEAEQIKMLLDVQKEIALVPVEVNKEAKLTAIQGKKYSKED